MSGWVIGRRVGIGPGHYVEVKIGAWRLRAPQ
jgi:hypothetical protein